MNEKLFNQCRLHVFTKVKETILGDFFFPDDCALNAASEPEMQDSIDNSTTCNNFGLTISTKKTKVMHQPTPGQPYIEPSITVKGQKLPTIDKLMYLGSILSKAVNIDGVVNCRIPKASTNFGRLHDTGNEGESASRWNSKFTVLLSCPPYCTLSRSP